jgi:hypothetical protein
MGAAGGAVGGAAAGVFVERTLRKIGNQIAGKFLGHHEEVRIGATYAYAVEKIAGKRSRPSVGGVG